MKCLSFFFDFVCFSEGVRWGGSGERVVTKKGKGIQEWLQDRSFYSVKINSKEHKCFLMLVNTELCTALTDPVT